MFGVAEFPWLWVNSCFTYSHFSSALVSMMILYFIIWLQNYLALHKLYQQSLRKWPFKEMKYSKTAMMSKDTNTKSCHMYMFVEPLFDSISPNGPTSTQLIPEPSGSLSAHRNDIVNSILPAAQRNQNRFAMNILDVLRAEHNGRI